MRPLVNKAHHNYEMQAVSVVSDEESHICNNAELDYLLEDNTLVQAASTLRGKSMMMPLMKRIHSAFASMISG
jgi:hypothetical protein